MNVHAEESGSLVAGLAFLLFMTLVATNAEGKFYKNRQAYGLQSSLYVLFYVYDSWTYFSWLDVYDA